MSATTTAAHIDLSLHAKQSAAFRTTATEILYGGAAGSGKSHLMRAAAIAWCGMIPGLQTYLFRRLRDDLIKNHLEGPKGLRALLAPWVAANFVTIVEDEIRFWNGSKIYLCHCKEERDRYKYLGAEIHMLLIDELTTFTEVIYRFLRSRVRMVGITLPKELDGRFPRILCASNPGNIGHGWVKKTFIDPRPALEIADVSEGEGGMRRQFIPARLDDNPSMATDDPGYGYKLAGLGNPALVRAMLAGDWSVVAGAFYPEWNPDRHVIKPFSIPEHWIRFRSFDWGSARPFVCLWFAVADDSTGHPKGSMICYRELYGDENNVGLRLSAELVADRIASREAGDAAAVTYSVADPSIFAHDGGPSIGKRMASRHIYFRPGDNKRVGGLGYLAGWDALRARLVGEDDRPFIYWFDSCLNCIRTIPLMQHDEARPEDMDSSGDDH